MLNYYITDSADQLLVNIFILLKCVSQKLMSRYGIHYPIPVKAHTYIGSSHKYTQVHVYYLYITMWLDSYVLITETQ